MTRNVTARFLEGRTHNNLHEGHAGYPGAAVGGNIPLAAVLSVLADYSDGLKKLNHYIHM